MATQRIVLRGTVTRVDEAGWSWLEIPELGGGGVEFGPCQALASDQLSTTVGMRVLVAGTESGEDLVILGAIGEEPPVVTGNRVFLQDAVPEPPLEYPMAGDLWWDTGDGNKPYVFSSDGEWVSVRDGAIAQTDLEVAAVRATADQAQLDANAALVKAGDAQATADGKVQSYFQASAPTGLTAADAGDLWFQTSDGYKMFRWTGTQWLEATDQRVAQSLKAADDAAKAAGLAQSTADRKISTYYQPNAPAAAGLVVGDLWVDTDEQNRLRRWNGGGWDDARDASIAASATQAAAALARADDALTAAQAAQATADGAIRTFYQSTAPTGLNDTTNLGDLWFDTDDNFAYRWLGSTNGGWKLIRDNTITQALAAAQNAQTTADGKIDAFYQTSQPATAGLGDLWFDTDDKNKPYYCSAVGPPAVWTLVRDQGIIDALNNAEAARLAAVTAQGKADQAIADAANAQATADGKVQTYFQTAAPVGLKATDVGDLWFDTDDGYRMWRWTGTAWVETGDTRISAAVQAAADANLAARVAGKSGASLAHDGSFELGHTGGAHASTETAWTSIKSDGGHTGTTYGRLLRSNASALYPGFEFQTSMQAERRYVIEIWARVPTVAPAAQAMYSRVSFLKAADGAQAWQTAVWTVPNDGVWHRYTYSVVYTADLRVQSYPVWVQHSGQVDTANAYLDVDDVAVYDVTEVSSKITTFYQPTIPVSTAIGDLWVHTGDSNKLYRATVVGSDEIKAGEWVLASDARLDSQATAIAALQTGLTTANGRIDGKAIIWVQASSPGGLTADDQGDIWIDTSTADRVMRVWSGTAWVNITDQKTLDVLATVNTKTATFYANFAAPPAATGAGDLWVVLDQGSRLRRATAAGTGSWVDVPGFGLQSLAATITARALGGITTFSGANPVGLTTVLPGDLWLASETVAGPSGTVNVKVLYQRNLTNDAWVKVDDPAAQTALLNAQTAANLADQKMRIFTEGKNAGGLKPLSNPTMAAGDVGDLWFNTDEGNKPYTWNGSVWVPTQDQLAAAVAMQGGDLITDGDFEFGTAGKSLSSALVQIVSASGPYSGSKALRLTQRTTADPNPGVLFGITISKARTYRVSVVARVPTTAPVAQTLLARVNTTGVAAGAEQQFSVPNDNTWRTYSYDVDTTTATRLVTDVYFGHLGTLNDATAVIEIDDASMVDVTAASAAQATAIAGLLSDGMNPNPLFDDWPAGQAGPSGYYAPVSVTRETAILRTAPAAARMAPAAGGQSYLGRSIPNLPNTDYVTITADFQVVSGGLSGAGLMVRWNTSAGTFDTLIPLTNEVPLVETGRWYRVAKTVRRPANTTGTYSGTDIFAMGGYGPMGTVTAKDVVFDYLNVRAASAAEIQAYGAAQATTVTALQNVVGAKTQVFYSSAVPTSISINDLWVSTSEQNKLYRAAAVGATTIAAGQWEAVPIGLAGLGSSVTARALGATLTFRQSTPPTGALVGDIWINTASGTPPEQYRWEIASGQSSPSWVRFTSDGLAPTGTVAAQVLPLGYGGVTIKWPAGVNADPLTYRVFFDTVNPPVKQLTDTGDLLTTTSVLPDGTKLVPGTAYYAMVRLVDRDGVGPAGPVATGSPVVVPASAVDVDVMVVNDLYSRSGYFGTISAESITSGDLDATVGILGQLQVGLASWTAPSANDPGGIRIPTPGGDDGMIHLPADGSEAVMSGRLLAASIVVQDNFRLLGAVNAIEGGLELANGVTAPATAPRLGASWSFSGAKTQLDTLAQTAIYEEADWWLFGSSGANGMKLYAQSKSGGAAQMRFYLQKFASTAPDTNYYRAGSICKHKGAYWVNFWRASEYGPGNADDPVLYKYNQQPGDTTWVTSGAYSLDDFGSYDAGSGSMPAVYDYALYSDGTTMWIARAGKRGKLQLSQVNPEGAYGSIFIGTQYSSTENFAANLSGLYVGPGDFGSTRVIVTFRGNSLEPRVYTISGSSLVRDTTREFGRPNGEQINGGIIWDGTRFKALTSNGKLYNYSRNVLAATRSVKYSKYDNDPAGLAQAETQASPAATYVQKPRQWLEVLMEPPGDAGGVDDPNALRVYIGNQRQADLATGQTVAVYDIPDTGGVDAPSSNGFVAARNAPGALRSVAADVVGRIIDLQGDGSGRAGPWSWDRFGKSAMTTARATLSANLAMAQRTWTNLNLDRIVEDNDSVISTVGGITRFTVKKKGRYRWTAKLRFVEVSGGFRAYSIKRFKADGTALMDVDVNYTGASSASATTLQGFDEVDMEIGEYCSLQAHVEVTATGTTTVDLQGSTTQNNYCYLQMTRVG